jgi:hypothetical protein
MTKAEQETTIRWAADEDMVSIFTAHPPTARKLTRAGYRPTRTTTYAGRETSWFFRIPLAEFRWRARPGRRSGRRLTEAQRQAAAERLAGARLARVSL